VWGSPASPVFEEELLEERSGWWRRERGYKISLDEMEAEVHRLQEEIKVLKTKESKSSMRIDVKPVGGVGEPEPNPAREVECEDGGAISFRMAATKVLALEASLKETTSELPFRKAQGSPPLLHQPIPSPPIPSPRNLPQLGLDGAPQVQNLPSAAINIVTLQRDLLRSESERGRLETQLAATALKLIIQRGKQGWHKGSGNAEREGACSNVGLVDSSSTSVVAVSLSSPVKDHLNLKSVLNRSRQLESDLSRAREEIATAREESKREKSKHNARKRQLEESSRLIIAHMSIYGNNH